MKNYWSPARFGRKVPPPTPAQRSARRVSIACFLLFIVCLALALSSVTHVAGSMVLGLAAFCFLMVGMVAAGEA